jgi:DNA topoisomerase-2
MEVDSTSSPLMKDYDYLLSMPIWSLSLEKVNELNKQMKNKQEEFNILSNTPIFTLWKDDLNVFLNAL